MKELEFEFCTSSKDCTPFYARLSETNYTPVFNDFLLEAQSCESTSRISFSSETAFNSFTSYALTF